MLRGQLHQLFQANPKLRQPRTVPLNLLSTRSLHLRRLVNFQRFLNLYPVVRVVFLVLGFQFRHRNIPNPIFSGSKVIDEPPSDYRIGKSQEARTPISIVPVDGLVESRQGNTELVILAPGNIPAGCPRSTFATKGIYFLSN